MGGRRWLWGLGAALLLIPLGLVAGYIWQAGLDLHSPRNVRGYLELCRRGHEDIACKALNTEARQHQGPLTLLFPNNTGDRELTARLGNYLAEHGYTAHDLTKNPAVRRRFFEAHALALGDLQTGTLQTMDGKSHRVVCKSVQNSKSCVLDGMTASNYFKPFGRMVDDGSLYLISAKTKAALGFMPFLDGDR